MLRRALQRLRVARGSRPVGGLSAGPRRGRSQSRLRQALPADDDPADPAAWRAPDRPDRGLHRQRRADPAAERADRTHSVAPRAHPRGPTPRSEDWQVVVNTVEELVSDGVPPSNREIRDLLLPAIDDLPDRDDLPAGFRLVLREIDRFLATRATPPQGGGWLRPACRGEGGRTAARGPERRPDRRRPRAARPRRPCGGPWT